MAAIRIGACVLLVVIFCSNASADTLTVEFKYSAPDAKLVTLAGTFNGWQGVDTLSKSGDVWTITKRLNEGYYEYKFIVDGSWVHDPANPRKILDGYGGFNSYMIAGNPPRPVRPHRSEPLPKEKLPRPILASHPDWIELYWAAWQIAWDKMGFGTPQNGLEPEYMDEAFDDQIFQWDSCFLTFYGVYGRDVFPAMAALDNFYKKQKADGYIQRIYSERTGEPTGGIPNAEEPLVNPALYAWAEAKYYQVTGDSSRIRRVLPHIIAYFDWVQTNLKAEGTEHLVYNSMFGSGMDNTPRPGLGKGAWVDFSCQQAMAAGNIGEMAMLIGDSVAALNFFEQQRDIAAEINALCWDKKTGFYYDRRPDGTFTNVMHIGGFWPMMAGIAPGEHSRRLIEHLQNPNEFNTPHRVATLARSDSSFDPLGHYWLGSVWAPTNYMVVKGLHLWNDELADSIAGNHIEMISALYHQGVPDTERVPYEQRFADGYHTLWECYSSEGPLPATRWDNVFYSRQDFAGWSALGPIALLIENVIGLKVWGSENSITWRIHRNDRHGIENLRLRDQHVDLVYDPVKKVIHTRAEQPFKLTIWHNDEQQKLEVKAGAGELKLGM